MAIPLIASGFQDFLFKLLQNKARHNSCQIWPLRLNEPGTHSRVCWKVSCSLELAQVKLCISCRFMKIFSEILDLETKTGHQVHILKSIICTHPTSAGSHVFCYLHPKLFALGVECLSFKYSEWHSPVSWQMVANCFLPALSPDRPRHCISTQFSSVCCC